MAERRGRLIAIEAAGGQRLARAAGIVADALGREGEPCGISRWDASGLFGDVVAAPAAPGGLSPRTLVLLYAADLAFRLRWEITPALDAGRDIVAAPYIATVVAFGEAAGLPRAWVQRMIGFAPAATHTCVLRERRDDQTWKLRPDQGFGECCATLLETRPQGFARRKTRRAMVTALSAASDDPRLRLRALAKTVKGWSPVLRRPISRKGKR